MRLSFIIALATTVLVNTPSIANNHTQVSQAPNRTRNTEELRVNGNEPFWSITISRKGIVYSTPESRQTFPYVAPLSASGRPADFVRVYRLRGRNNTINTLVIKKVDCSDGMSDTKYPYSATFILGNTVLDGCARKP